MLWTRSLPRFGQANIRGNTGRLGLCQTRLWISTARNHAKTAHIFLSNSTNPYFNLAVEDWLFRDPKYTESMVLLFYRNSPCVIIGRNQNPWKEINFSALNKLGVPFVRRRSGGGTVYHDLGNTNYSIAMPREAFDRTSHAQLVADAVATLGPSATVNERNDIVVDGFKISSAYKLVNKRAYHHGTMLIDARLGDLGDLLRNTKHTLQTKGVDSVRSPVKNLNHFQSGITHDSFVTAVSNEFTNTYGGDSEIHRMTETLLDNPKVRDGFEELQSWEWSHGQTPEFTHELHGSFDWGSVAAHIHSKKGVILDCKIEPDGQDFDADAVRKLKSISKDLVERKYGILDVDEGDGYRRNIIDWLRRDM